MREAGLKLLAAAPGEHVLEIGFGTGHILADLPTRPADGKVFGIDISENMLDHARGVLSNKGLIDRVSLDCGDAKASPTVTTRWTGYSCASPWNCSTRRTFLRCWQSASGFCGRRADRRRGRIQGRQGRFHDSCLRVDTSPLSQPDGLPADLCSPRTGGDGLCHRGLADGIDVGSRGDREGQKARLSARVSSIVQ